MNVLALSGHYLPGYKGGGPIKTLKNLVEQSGNEFSFRIITSDRDLGDDSPYRTVNCGCWNPVGNASVFYVRPGLKGLLQIARILWKENFDLVYLNSFFSIRFSFFPLLMSRLLSQQVVLGPRGEFSEGALTLKSSKKRSFISVYRLLGLHRRTIFQASSEFEAEDIRRVLGTKVEIKVAEDIGAQEFTETLPIRSDDELKAVFVSRITPKKNLLAALEMVRDVQHTLCYHIYGPIEDQDYWSKCKEVIVSLPPHVTVEHKGQLAPSEVVITMAKYDVFVMPTKGENYGHVIAEALCAGLPILIADTTPWRNLQQLGIGWDLPLSNPGGFCSVLDHLATIPAGEHRKMREVVLAWAKTKFSRGDAVESNIEIFRYAYEKNQG